MVARCVAIVGAGQAGTLLAVGLQRDGCEVTLFSDRSAEEILNETAPTGTAALFAEGLAVERRLGVDTYEDRFLPMDGVHLFFCPRVGVELLHLGAPLDDAGGAAVDVRLKSYDRMRQLEAIGGKVVVERVSAARLDEIAGDHELTFVATGKGGLADVFPRHAGRSVYRQPQRRLAMVIARGISTHAGAFSHRVPGHTPVCFNLFGDAGEMFWAPFLHRSEGHCWNLVFEARQGSVFDRFGEVRSLDQCFDVARELVRKFTPWDWEVLRDMEPVAGDRFAWLVGAVCPTVRHPVGETASGHLVMSLGDTSMAYDPIGGQGAGSGTRQAGWYHDAIVERGNRPFDRQWMADTFEQFFSGHGEGTYRFNNVLLEPLDRTGVRIMKACFASPAAAAAFLRNFNRPPGFFPWLQDRQAAEDWIAAVTGQSARRVVARGTARILKGRMRQRVTGRHFPHATGRGWLESTCPLPPRLDI